MNLPESLTRLIFVAGKGGESGIQRNDDGRSGMAGSSGRKAAVAGGNSEAGDKGRQHSVDFRGISGMTSGMAVEWITPALAEFLAGAESEALLIPQERQLELRQVATWIAGRLAVGQHADLVFICTHNSRRSHFSQIWAAIAAFRHGLGGVRTFSGGTEVTAMNERVADSLRRSGLVVSVEDPAVTNPRFHVRYSVTQPPLECFSKIHHQLPNPSHDYCAVMTCSHADDACPVVPGCSLRVPVRYTDPKVADGTPDETRIYDERSQQICREMLYLMRMAGGTA